MRGFSRRRLSLARRAVHPGKKAIANTLGLVLGATLAINPASSVAATVTQAPSITATPTSAASIGTSAPGEKPAAKAEAPLPGGLATTTVDTPVTSSNPTSQIDAAKPVTLKAKPTPAFATSPGSTSSAPGGTELVAERDEKKKVFQNADGTKTAELFASPVHAKDSKGSWQNIDTTLSDQNGRLQNKVARVHVDLAKSGADAQLESLKFEDGSQVSFGLAGARVSAPTVTGSTATYSQVLKGATLRYTSNNSGVKEDLILDSASGPTSFTFPMTLSGVTAQMEKASGDVVFAGKDGHEVGRLTHGWIEDSAIDPKTGSGALSDGISYALVPYGAGSAVVMTLDAKWLADPARKFPVDVDPTVVSASAAADDTFVTSNFNVNSAGLDVLKIGSYDSGAHVAASFLRFDSVNSLGNVRVITTEFGAFNSYSWSCAPRGVGVYQVTQAWNGQTMTGWPGASYGNRYLWANFAMGSNGCPAGNAFWKDGLNDLVQGWVNGSVPNFGLTMRVDPGSEGDNLAYKYFKSSEAGGVYLKVTYSPYGAQYSPSTTWQVPVKNNSAGKMAVNVINTGRDCWPANGNIRLSYHLMNSSGTVINYNGARTLLPSTVCPGQVIGLSANVDPVAPGSYRLAWDMVDEGLNWFSDDFVPVVYSAIGVPNYPPAIDSALPLGGVLPNNAPTLSVVAHDQDGWPGSALNYDFHICNGPANNPGTCSDSGVIAASSWNPPALFWNQPYYWHVTVSDTNATTATGESMIVARVAQPVVTSHLGDDAYTATNGGVSLNTGNFVAAMTDASVAGVGPGLSLGRVYNSLDTSSGAFGTGWSFNFGSHLVVEAGGLVLLTYPDGRQGRFAPNPDGSYYGPAGYFAQIQSVGGGYTFTDGSGNVSTYDTSGRLVSLATAAGLTESVAYDSSSHISSIHNNATSRNLTFTWAGSHVTKVVTDPVVTGGPGLTWTYAYTGNSLTSVCNPKAIGAHCSTYGYTAVNGAQLLTTITLPKGNVAETVHYASDNTVDWRKDGTNKQWSFTSSTNAGAKTVTITDPLSHTTKYTFDPSGRLISYTDQLNLAKTYAYNDGGFLTQVTDANSNTILLTVDLRGNILRRSTSQYGQTVSSYYSYFSGAVGDPRNGRLVQERDPRSSSSSDNAYLTSTAYDSHGLVSSKTTPATSDFPSGRSTVWTYSTGTGGTVDGVGTTPAGLPLTVTDPNGRATTYSYDRFGNVRRVVDPVGLRTDMNYDNLGRKTSSVEFSDTFPAGLQTSFSYDEMNQVVGQTDPAVHDPLNGGSRTVLTQSVYDANENLTSSTVGDTENRDVKQTTTYDFDDNGRVIATHDPGGGVSSITYDAAGNVASQSSPIGAVTTYSYTARNELARTTLVGLVDDPTVPTAPHDLIEEQRTYDAAGRLSTTADALGRTRQYQYLNNDLLASITLLGFHNPDNSTRNLVEEAYTYDNAGNVLSQSTGGGLKKVTAAFDAAGVEVSQTLDPAGLNRVTTRAVDGNLNVTRETTTQGTSTQETRFTYDADNNVLSQTAENGTTDLTTSFGYDRRGLQTSTTDARGAGYTTTAAYDEAGRQISVTSPTVNVAVHWSSPVSAQLTSKAGFDSFGNLIASTHPNPSGPTTTYQYDKLNRLTSYSTPIGTSTCCGTGPVTEQWTYNADGQILTHRDARASTTSYDYDKLDRVVRMSDPQLSGQPAPGRTRFAYDPVGNRTSTIDQLGATVATAFDDLNRTKSVTQIERYPSAASFATTFSYDDMGDVLAVKDPLGYSTSSAYNAAGELKSTADQLGKVTSITRDVAGRPVSVVDPLLRSIQLTYDPAGRLTGTKARAANGTQLAAQSFGYDSASNQTSAISPNGYQTTRTFDAMSRLTSIIDPIASTHSATTAIGYDYNSNRSVVTDPRGNATWTTYNVLDLPSSTFQPTTTAHPNDSDGRTDYTYDGAGNLTLLEEPGTVRNRSYDALGNLVHEDGYLGSTTAARTINRDLKGRITSIGTPDSPEAFTYNDRDSIISQSGSEGSASFAYDGDSQLTRRTDSSGVTNISYTQRGQQATVSDPLTGAAFSYGYDDAAQLTTVNAGTTPRTFTYDGMGRLLTDQLGTTASGNWRSTTYGYDANSNVTSQNLAFSGGTPSQSNGYGYDQSNRLTSWVKNGATTSYVYDDAGNRTQAGTASSTFDQRNELVSDGTNSYSYSPRGTLDSSKAVATGVVSTYQFDAFDRMVYDPTDATMVPNGGLTYDALDRLYARNSIPFAYDGTSINPTSDGTSFYARDAAEAPLSMKTGSVSSALLANRHGDVVGAYVPGGAVQTNRTDYDPFGKSTTVSGATGRLGYQGSWTNGNSSAQHVDMWSRTYTPATGTFNSQDSMEVPLGSALDANKYIYANANPVTYNDPTGRQVPVLELTRIGEIEELTKPITVDPELDLPQQTGPKVAEPKSTPSNGKKVGQTPTLGKSPTPTVPDRDWSNDAVPTPRPLTNGKGNPAPSPPPAGPGLPKPKPTPPPLPHVHDDPNGHPQAPAPTIAPDPFQTGDPIEVAPGDGIDQGPFPIPQGSDDPNCGQSSTCVAQKGSPTQDGLEDPSGGNLFRRYYPRQGEECVSSGVRHGDGFSLGVNDTINCDSASDQAKRTTDKKRRDGSETFFRGMSWAEYQSLIKSGGLWPLNGESFVTQSLPYVQQLAERKPDLYPVIVQFQVSKGTRDALIANGARDVGGSATYDEEGLGGLPVISRGDRDVVHIKAELGAINYGLRSGSVGIFNDRIIGFGPIASGSS